jgi:hypothetical protein
MIKVTLKDGVSRELKFSAYSLMLAEKELGVSFVASNIFEEFSLEKIIVLLWASLLHANRKLTIEQSAELVPFDNDEELNQLVLGLLKAFMECKGQDVEELEKKIAENLPKKEKAASSGKTGKPSQL